MPHFIGRVVELLLTAIQDPLHILGESSIVEAADSVDQAEDKEPQRRMSDCLAQQYCRPQRQAVTILLPGRDRSREKIEDRYERSVRLR